MSGLPLANGAPGRDASWRGRLEGLVPPAIESRRVLVAGCGSVGSFMAGELARSGVRRFILVDPDVVEWANLTRTVYGHADVGRRKVDALGDHLRGVFPDIEVEGHPTTLQDLGDGLGALMRGADLVIAAVDDPRATGRVNRYAHALGVPTLFVGLYRGARGGEVIVSLPGRTPCFHCATGGVRQVAEEVGGESVERSRDYGTNRLVAEVALGSDIHYVCAAAVKVALSALSMDEPGSPLGGFLSGALDQGQHYLILGMTPGYYLFPATHRQAFGQHAFQSIWMATASRPECGVCGDPEHRETID